MRFALLVSVVILLGGCAADGRIALEDSASAAIATAPAPQGCDAVASHATSVGEDFTRSLADEAVVHRIAESRGALIQKGLRRVKVAERRTICEKHINLGPGLQEYHCVAEARLCGS
jgi:hypothetical protein